MTLDQYLDEWTADADLDLSALEHAARNVPLLHAKWWKFYTTERLRYRKLDADYKVLYRQKWEYFLGKMDDVERLALGWAPQPLKILSQNVGIYIEGDPDIQKILLKKVYLEEILKFIEDVLKQVNNRNFTIKSAIDFLRFKNGL
tara:strand:+ start:797 stop:1231 length:435 start_codon:yes stop_codon:yes gene_type:complete